jgi:hypothetical protein
VISLRKALGTTALGAVAAVTFSACASHEDGGGDDLRDRPGCTGVCSGDGGAQNGGTVPDSGTSDAGSQTRPTEMSVAQARNASAGTWVKLKSVVIQTVEATDAGDSQRSFWVVDPANPRQGLWVSKSLQDVPTSYVPKVGDRIDLEGWVQPQDRFEPFTAYRPRLAHAGGTARLVITRLGTLTPPADHAVSPSTGFGNADGGFGRPNPEYAGSRVHITGPLALSDPNPRALRRLSADPEDPRFLGFEVEGGILVRDDTCDWRRKALDGGSVLFPGGIRGVWETYAYAPCQDRASADAGCVRDPARVPGTEGPDGGANLFTYVLHPRDCETDLKGEWDAGP